MEQAADPRGGPGRGGTSTGDFWVKKAEDSANGPAHAHVGFQPLVPSACYLATSVVSRQSGVGQVRTWLLAL
jgi:hypothetical protein